MHLSNQQLNLFKTFGFLKIPSLIFTEIPIPIVINAKNITSSNGLLTGFLNLTIDKAPIIPSERAKFPAITVVIIIVIGGNNA